MSDLTVRYNGTSVLGAHISYSIGFLSHTMSPWSTTVCGVGPCGHWTSRPAVPRIERRVPQTFGRQYHHQVHLVHQTVSSSFSIVHTSCVQHPSWKRQMCVKQVLHLSCLTDCTIRGRPLHTTLPKCVLSLLLTIMAFASCVVHR